MNGHLPPPPAQDGATCDRMITVYCGDPSRSGRVERCGRPAPFWSGSSNLCAVHALCLACGCSVNDPGCAPTSPEVSIEHHPRVVSLREALSDALPVLDAAQAHIMIGSIGTLNALAAAVHTLNRGEGDNATRIAELRAILGDNAPALLANLRVGLRAAIPVIEAALGDVGRGAASWVLARALRAFGGGGPEGIERASGRLVELRALVGAGGDS